MVVTLSLDEISEALHHAPHAAHREMHAKPALEEGDQAVDRGDVERIAADEQWMEAEREAQSRIAHMLGDEPMHAAIAFQPHKIGKHLHHVRERSEGHGPQLFEADAVDGFRLTHEGAITGHIAQRQPPDLSQHRSFVP